MACGREGLDFLLIQMAVDEVSAARTDILNFSLLVGLIGEGEGRTRSFPLSFVDSLSAVGTVHLS